MGNLKIYLENDVSKLKALVLGGFFFMDVSTVLNIIIIIITWNIIVALSLRRYIYTYIDYRFSFFTLWNDHTTAFILRFIGSNHSRRICKRF
jgi:hypothetical protein